MVCLWWWIAGLGILLAFLSLVVKPLAYPVLYCFCWLGFAFMNRLEPVLPNYWHGYPGQLVDFAHDSLTLCFPTLQSWLLDGFPDK